MLEGFGVDVPPGERIDRAGAERDQVRADTEQFDVVLAVIVDHFFQRSQIVRGHFRQLFRGRVALHDTADVCVGCADVEAGIADGHGVLLSAFLQCELPVDTSRPYDRDVFIDHSRQSCEWLAIQIFGYV